MNQAAVEIAKILLEFEIQRKKTAAESQTVQAQDAATATDQPQKVNRQRDSTPTPDNAKNKSEHR